MTNQKDAIGSPHSLDMGGCHVPSNVSSCVSAVKRRILALDQGDFVNRQLYLPSSHILNSKGKYLRPTLVLLSAHAIGADPKEYIDLAAAAELLHTSSLVHDDIIDGDRTRRGVPAVHVKYGKEAAILGGDALISKAIQLSSAYGKQVIYSMANAALEMCAGELLDYSFYKGRKVPDMDEYLEIARLKSASLIGASCSSVPIHAKDKRAKEFYSFGLNFGIAFQIKDDISDIKKEKASKRNKPNIIISISKHEGISSREAAEKAEVMMDRYTGEGLSSIKSAKTRDMLSEYTELFYSY